MRMATRAWSALAGAGLGALLAIAGTAGPAAAHARLDSSTPADGIRLEQAPTRVELDLTERVELGLTTVTLTDGSGRVTRLGPIRLLDRPSAGSQLLITRPGEPANVPATLVAELPVLKPDLYRVAWSTVSSDDLHATSGVLVFGVQRDVAVRAVAQDPLPPAGEVLARWLGLLGAATTAGAGLLLVLLGRGLGGAPGRRAGEAAGRAVGAGVRRRLLRLAAAGGLVAAAGGLVVLGLQVGGLLGAGESGAVWSLLTGGDYGWRWLLRELAALALAAIPPLALRGRSAAATGSPAPGPPERGVPHSALGAPRVPQRLAGVSATFPAQGIAGALAFAVYGVTTGLTGHSGAAASRHLGRVLAEGLHVAAALLWAGTLLAAVVALLPSGAGAGRDAGPDAGAADGAAPEGFRALLRPVLTRFGLVAAGCLAVMTVTGLVLAGARVATVDALLFSTYGRTLLLKTGLALAALVAGAVNAAVLHPRLVPRRWRPGLSGIRLLPVLVAETVLAVGVVGAASALAATQPADGRGWSAATFAQPLASGHPQDLVETVQVAPNRPGRNFVTVDVFNTRRPEPGSITGVTVTVRGTDGAAATAALQPQGDGRWLLATDAFTASGRWDVSVSVLRDGLAPTVAGYPWSVAEPDARLQRTVVSSAPLAPWLDRAAAALGIAALLALGLGALRRRRGSRGPGRDGAVQGPVPAGGIPAAGIPVGEVRAGAAARHPEQPGGAAGLPEEEMATSGG